jgi:hypothetical protein
MSLAYLLHVLCFLDREAPRIWWCNRVEDLGVDPEGFGGDIEAQARKAYLRGREWMRTTPLYRAVAEQADRQIGISG